MKVEVHKTLAAMEAVKGGWRRAIIPVGTYELKEIANPIGYSPPWLVLKGGRIGGVEDWWRSLGNDVVTITED